MPLNALVIIVSIKVTLWCMVVSGVCLQAPLLEEFCSGLTDASESFNRLDPLLDTYIIQIFKGFGKMLFECLSSWWLTARKEKLGKIY